MHKPVIIWRGDEPIQGIQLPQWLRCPSGQLECVGDENFAQREKKTDTHMKYANAHTSQVDNLIIA
jgi:hypothetical protein